MNINSISFPKLNINLLINRVAFHIFGKPIYWYGIIIATGVVLGVCYALARAKKEGIESESILDVLLWGVPTCIVCARIFYVIGDWSFFSGNLWKIIAIWEGGIAIYGALIGAVIVGVTYSRVKKIDTGLLFDVCTPAVMIGQIVGRWGNFVNVEVYGTPTNLLIGMSINGSECVHPLFLYESLWMCVGLIGILIYQNRKKVNGEIFLLYTIWYGVGRGGLESLRQEEYVLKIFGVPMSQIVSITVVLVALAILIYMYCKKNTKQTPCETCKCFYDKWEASDMREDEQLKIEVRRLQQELYALQNLGASEDEILEKSKELDSYLARMQKKISLDTQ